MEKFSRLIRSFLVSCMAFVLVFSTVTANASAAPASSNKSPVGWADFSLGPYGTYAVKEDGTVWGWGSNSKGIFDSKDYIVRSPIQVRGLYNVVAVSSGDQLLALKKDGTVWGYGGQNFPSPVKGLKGVKQMEQTFSSSYAVKQDGTLWAWGFHYGKAPAPLPEWDHVAFVSIGFYGDLLVLKQDGTVWQQGANCNSKLAGSTIELKKTPVQVKGLSDIITVANGGGCYYALQSDGTVWAWGHNQGGQLGDGTNIDRPEPVKIEGISNVIDVKATQGGPLYLRKDGTVWTNGLNNGGQLGIGTYEDKNVPVHVEGLTKIKKIDATGENWSAMAIREDGILFSWGNGNVGDGTEWSRTTPTWIKSNDAEVFDRDPTLVKVNGQGLYFDQPPVSVNGRTMVPLRKIFESLAIDVTWEDSTSTIKASNGKTKVELTVGNSIAFVNGQQVQLDSPPVVINDRTLVPVRFIAEAFGATVGWEENTQTASIKLKLPPSEGYVPKSLTLQLPPGLDTGWHAAAKSFEKYLGDQLGIPVTITLAEDDLTAIQDLEAGSTDIGLLTPNGYIAAHETFKVADPLVQSLYYSFDDVTDEMTKDMMTSYKTMILVKASTPIQTAADLKGKRFGYQASFGNEGLLFPGAWLTKNGLNLQTDIQGTLIEGYDKAIEALMDGKVDAVAVLPGYRKAMLKKYPNIMQDTRVLAIVDQIPTDVFAVRSDMDPAWKKKIQDALIAIDPNSQLGDVMKHSYAHYGYAASDDKNFNGLREALTLMGIEY